MIEQPNNTNDQQNLPVATTNQTAQSHSRRSFLTKASVGIVIASMPAKSVWASGGGVAQSIVASGHGSDFADGDCIKLRSPGYWMNNNKQFHTLNFATVFGGPAFPRKSGQAFLANTVTFGQILTTNALRGMSNVNFHMVAMYLNALNSGLYGVDYPIVGSDKPFKTQADFARYLYLKASQIGGAAKLGMELSAIIRKYPA